MRRIPLLSLFYRWGDRPRRVNYLFKVTHLASVSPEFDHICYTAPRASSSQRLVSPHKDCLDHMQADLPAVSVSIQEKKKIKHLQEP